MTRATTRRRPLAPALSRCVRSGCTKDTSRQVAYGHCLGCGQHIGATTAREWGRKVREPCPRCGRSW